MVSMNEVDLHSAQYQAIVSDLAKIVDGARSSAARSVNAAMTAAYWLIGHRIVELEQSGDERAEYGTALIERLATDLTRRFGRGFSRQNIQNMRLFYLSYPPEQIRQTASGESAINVGDVDPGDLLSAFPLQWSAYVRRLSIQNLEARDFFEAAVLGRRTSQFIQSVGILASTRIHSSLAPVMSLRGKPLRRL